MRTQICIIGAGPAGMLLSQLLHLHGIENIVLERASREHVLSRIRAGVLERGFVGLMHEARVGARLECEGIVHQGVMLTSDELQIHIDFQALAGHNVVIYGQTEVTRDLYEAREAADGGPICGVSDVRICDVDRDAPYVTCTANGRALRINCDYVAGCDGFHGVSRKTIPETVRREFEKVYPFGWLGVLSRTPPVNHELIYASSARGFALCSMRNSNLSRYYIQCSMQDSVDNWSDAQFWDELRRRIPAEAAARLVTGPSIEKSIAPLRSFVVETMQWGRLFLCGDAAHIVPPTGAKGLNTAGSDIHYLSRALIRAICERDHTALDAYSQTALARVWKTQRFSWQMTSLLHHFPGQNAYESRIAQAEFAVLAENRESQAALAANYVGLPY